MARAIVHDIPINHHECLRNSSVKGFNLFHLTVVEEKKKLLKMLTFHVLKLTQHVLSVFASSPFDAFHLDLLEPFKAGSLQHGIEKLLRTERFDIRMRIVKFIVFVTLFCFRRALVSLRIQDDPH